MQEISRSKSDYVNGTDSFKDYLVTLDPFLLWPITEKIKKKVFRAEFEGCDVNMHNLKSGKLIDVKVARNAQLDTFATRHLQNNP